MEEYFLDSKYTGGRSALFPSAPEGFNPSSWKQIVENMRSLIDLNDKLGDIYSILEETGSDNMSELINTILQTINDIIDNVNNIIQSIEDNQGIINVYNPEDSGKDLSPDDYKGDITYEFKKTSIVGLSNKRWFNELSHALIMTVISKSVDDDNFVSYQLATGKNMHQYYRLAEYSEDYEKNIWGEWVELRSGTEILKSDSEPDAERQVAGDFWMLKK